jgi:hypothetical protein
MFRSGKFREGFGGNTISGLVYRKGPYLIWSQHVLGG